MLNKITIRSTKKTVGWTKLFCPAPAKIIVKTVSENKSFTIA
jgi:hypothetical protein